jgi:hypothetical protein
MESWSCSDCMCFDCTGYASILGRELFLIAYLSVYMRGCLLSSLHTTPLSVHHSCGPLYFGIVLLYIPSDECSQFTSKDPPCTRVVDFFHELLHDHQPLCWN